MINKDLLARNAKKIRKILGVDDDSPVDVFALLEGMDNITTVFLPMSKGMSGLCIRDEDNLFIGINSSLSKGRQRFTAAHELCHLFYHNDKGFFVCNKSFETKRDTEEIEADLFASYFLAPSDALYDFLEKNGFHDDDVYDYYYNFE